MSDRLIRGGLAGALAGVWLIISEVTLHNVLHIAATSWLDAMVYVIAGHKPRTAPDYVLGVVGQLILSGMLGALFVWILVRRDRPGNYLLRGIGYGAASWWTLQAITTIYHVTELSTTTWQTDLTTLFSAATWGLLLGWLVHRWDYGLLDA